MAVQELVDRAAREGRRYCEVPESLLPYDPRAVEFDHSVHLLRAGQHVDVFDIEAYGASVDGVADDTHAVVAADAAAGRHGGEVMVAGGPARIGSDLTLSSPMRFLHGGEIAPDEDVLVSVESPVMAGGHRIFGGEGAVRLDYTTEPINVLWFGGESLDEKWNKMRAGFQHNVRKHVVIPNPGPTSHPWSVELDGASNIAAWRLDGPLVFDGDRESHMTLEVHGILQAEKPMRRMIHLSPGNKLENFNVITELFLNGRGRSDWLIDIRGLSRGTFGGMWHLKGMSAEGGGVRIEAACGTVSETTFPHIDATVLAGTAVQVEGSEQGVVGVDVGMIYAQNGTSPSDRVLEIRGTVRELSVRNIDYRDPRGQKLADALRLASTADGVPTDVVIGPTHAQPAEHSVRTDLPSGRRRMRRIEIGPVMDGDLALGGLSESRVKVLAPARVLLGELTRRTEIVANSPRCQIEDRGAFNTVNGLGRARPGDGAPDPDNWSPGNTVEVSDGENEGRVYRLRPDGTWLRLA